MDPTKTNQIASIRLYSWFNSLNIQCYLVDNAIMVIDSKGIYKKVKIFEFSKSKLNIKPSVVNHRNLTFALNGFKKIVEELGYTYSSPVNRGIADHRLKFEDNFELISMRHCDFRRSPNPPDEVFKEYKKVMDLACYKFLSFNYKLCKRNLLDHGDLKSYASVWLINFLGNFRDPNNSEKETKNKLFYYLTQKFFCEFKDFLERQEKRCAPEFDDFCLSSFGGISDEGILNTDLLPKNELERKEDAMEELRERLSKLPKRKAKQKLLSVYNAKTTRKDTKIIIENILKDI